MTTTKKGLTDKEMDQVGIETAAKVNQGDKIRIKIPLDPLNKEDMVVPVVINGHTWAINRGQSVEVPEQVAAILEDAGYI